MEPPVLPFPGLDAYRLLDSGNGEKLESYAGVVLRRPDPQAIWSPRKDKELWAEADLSFERESDRGGKWVPENGRKEWTMPIQVPGLKDGLDGLQISIHPTPFKHIGLFPEQAANWVWLEQKRRALVEEGIEKPRLLNLFAYTGVASVIAAASGWEVTHVDSSKASLDWAAANAKLSGLDASAIRWMCEDALKYAGRELRRGKTYHAILLDPPAYGRGPKGEKWLFSSGISDLLNDCANLLDVDSSNTGVCLSAYAIEFSPLSMFNLMCSVGFENAEVGELALPEEGGSRHLPCGFCARS